MTQWLAMVLANGSYGGKQIVDAEALLPALTPQIVSSPADGTGDAVRLLRFRLQRRDDVGGRDEISHSGAFELGAGTNFLFMPSADVAIVALTNATPAGVPRR